MRDEPSEERKKEIQNKFLEKQKSLYIKKSNLEIQRVTQESQNEIQKHQKNNYFKAKIKEHFENVKQ